MRRLRQYFRLALLKSNRAIDVIKPGDPALALIFLSPSPPTDDGDGRRTRHTDLRKCHDGRQGPLWVQKLKSSRRSSGVFLLKKLNSLRMNQAHRSATIVLQRFDHPHHGLERTHSLMAW